MLRFLTAGESHGPELTAILEGFPAGVPVTPADINEDLRRRQRSAGSGGRMSIEQDQARITAGVMAGRSTGGPIALAVVNRDFSRWKDRAIPPFTVPRPGHADLTAAVKYGYRDLRLSLERASARETTSRVAVGAVCRRLLAEFGITVGSLVLSIGSVSATLPDEPDYGELFRIAEESPVRCADAGASAAMVEEIACAGRAGDTVGGVFACVALNVPVGLGSHVHWDRRLSGRLIAAVGSIPAIKGVELGDAFEHAAQWGTQVHDPIVSKDDKGATVIRRSSNRAGGLEGGITTGEPIVVKAAMKPISTTLHGIASVDLATGQSVKTVYERSDVCAVPRACVVAESMICFVLADALVEKLGGDSLQEMLPRFEELRSPRLDELPMDNTPWRFGYE